LDGLTKSDEQAGDSAGDGHRLADPEDERPLDEVGPLVDQPDPEVSAKFRAQGGHLDTELSAFLGQAVFEPFRKDVRQCVITSVKDVGECDAAPVTQPMSQLHRPLSRIHRSAIFLPGLTTMPSEMGVKD
jgi:hypothetical protein